MNIFDINNIFTTIFSYPLSYVEFIATLFGLVSIWFAARQNILTWATGFINVICSFAIFYQVRLYSDMFLQIYFFGTSIYGWLVWNKQQQTDKTISVLATRERIQISLIIIVTTLILGILVKNIHLLFPKKARPFLYAPYFLCAQAESLQNIV